MACCWAAMACGGIWCGGRTDVIGRLGARDVTGMARLGGRGGNSGGSSGGKLLLSGLPRTALVCGLPLASPLCCVNVNETINYYYTVYIYLQYLF
jgi:hypothetical protein